MSSPIALHTKLGPLTGASGDSHFTDSRAIAAYFGKRHDHVLRDIDRLTKNGFRRFAHDSVPTFDPSAYIQQQNGQTYRCYGITRSGFMLLAMGFQGAKATAFKCALIEAFKELEMKVAAQSMALADGNPQEAVRLWIEQYEQDQRAKLGDTPTI
ncbi:MAG: Rha family transcriptional regulator [Devosia sp.]